MLFITKKAVFLRQLVHVVKFQASIFFREFLKNVGPLQLADEVKKRSAVQLVEEILSAGKTSTFISQRLVIIFLGSNHFLNTFNIHSHKRGILTVAISFVTVYQFSISGSYFLRF